MITHKYGSFGDNQILDSTTYLRKQIFFLLLYVDKSTSYKYPEVDVENAFICLMEKMDGLNSLLLEPPALVHTMALLEAALKEYNKESNKDNEVVFSFNKYRKLILDAGNEILKINKSVMVDNNGNAITIDSIKDVPKEV